MEDQDAKFKRYLVGEFFWELEQHPGLAPQFNGAPRDAIEVLSFHGYHDMRIRFLDVVYDIHLSWQKVVPPSIQRIEDDL